MDHHNMLPYKCANISLSIYQGHMSGVKGSCIINMQLWYQTLFIYLKRWACQIKLCVQIYAYSRTMWIKHYLNCDVTNGWILTCTSVCMCIVVSTVYHQYACAWLIPSLIVHNHVHSSYWISCTHVSDDYLYIASSVFIQSFSLKWLISWIHSYIYTMHMHTINHAQAYQWYTMFIHALDTYLILNVWV